MHLAGACWQASLGLILVLIKFVQSGVAIMVNALKVLVFASRVGLDPIAKTRTALAIVPDTDNVRSLLVGVQASAFAIMDGAVPDVSVWPSTCR